MKKRDREKIAELESDLKAAEGDLHAFGSIENSFFEIDEEKKIATVRLRFAKASDLFDTNYLSRTPIFSDEFLDWVASAFRLIPAKYKICADVSLDDDEGYGGEELESLFRKNILLEYKARISQSRRKNRIAYILIGIGLLFFVAMITVEAAWQSESLFKKIFTYVSDIATTVTLWEALGILIVEGTERRATQTSLITRFHAIRFHKTAKEEAPDGKTTE